MTQNLPIRELEQRPVYPVEGFINSRRFGPGSMGINLARGGIRKVVCNYRCTYCQYEVDAQRPALSMEMEPDRGFTLSGEEYVDYVMELFKEKLDTEGDSATAITFSGNCEPTLNPYFAEVAGKVMRTRDAHDSDHIKSTPMNVLTNGTTLNQPEVARALEQYFDKICIKLDGANQEEFARADAPVDRNTSIYRIIGDAGVIVPDHGIKVAQTMIYRNGNGLSIQPENLREYEQLLQIMDPQEVHLYTLRYQPPADIERATEEELQDMKDTLIKTNGKWQGKISCYSKLMDN